MLNPRFVAALASAALPLAAAAQPTFTALPSLTPTSWTSAGDVSDDGSIVVGISGSTVYRWSAATGATFLPVPSIANFSSPVIVSGDGSTIVTGGSGTIPGVHSPYETWRWTSASGWNRMLPTGFSDQSYPRGLSTNGSIAMLRSASGIGSTVSSLIYPDNSQTPFPTNPPGATSAWTASAISGDARSAVGGAGFNTYYWSIDGGFVHPDFLPGATSSLSTAISPDGLWIAGSTWSINTNWRGGFIWSAASGTVQLDYGAPSSPVFGSLSPADIADGAAAVVGSGGLLAGGGNQAFLWTPQTGTLHLHTWLESFGIDLTGWHLDIAQAVSRDGRVIVGDGTYTTPGGDTISRGWMVTIPSPGASAPGLIALAAAARRRR